ncbi:MAG: 2-C-methyl-D-erythritol 2,4-cyclodiphosphate synthase [Phycisphaerales bacterium]|nr:2-C-methyl-D-erythritol 2,4-cyclodiphosphate synthase [Phycisphaerales bacterium]
MATTEGLRVGVGYDIHRLAEGRALVLGGVTIPSDKGLVGHSDGDVVLHAITDALLGACSLPDIGDLFPDTDPMYKGIESKILMQRAMEKVKAAGYRPGNIDCIVHAEKPKLTAFKKAMAESIASIVGIPVDTVNVKAKTNEGMGPVGSFDAIATTAVATVVKISQ